MGNTIGLFKKIGEIKETFHASMGKTKDRNSKDLMEAEEIKNFFFTVLLCILATPS